MRKISLWLTACFLLGTFSAHSIELKVMASETNGLLQFLMGCERHNERNALYLQLKESKYYTAQTQQMLEKWDEVEKYNMLNFEGFPESRHNGRSVSDLIVIQSVRAKNALELAQNCMGYFTQSELKKFREVLLYFEPIYRELFWQPNLKQINAKLKTLQAFVKQKNIPALFNQAAAFYGTRWENDLPFYVMVNPLPGKVTYTSARPMGQVLIADLALTEKDLTGWLGVVFHEMCHVLFNNQPREKQEALERFFTSNTATDHRLPAYNWFNETMATALGNGWVVEKINGHLDSSEWYSNHYIDQFAHVVYPLVKQYVEAGKTMDQAFADACIKGFKEKFEQINTETDHLFTFIDMVADSMPQQSYHELFRYFYSRSVNCQTPFDGEHLLKVSEGLSTKVFVITSGKEEKLKTVREKFGFDKLDLCEKSCIYYFLEKEGKNYFVLSLNEMGDFGKAMEKLAAQKTLPDKTGVIVLE